jgi:hypothetical protein
MRTVRITRTVEYINYKIVLFIVIWELGRYSQLAWRCFFENNGDIETYGLIILFGGETNRILAK